MNLSVKWATRNKSRPRSRLTSHPHCFWVHQAIHRRHQYDCPTWCKGYPPGKKIVGALLYYGRAVGNKLLVALGAIGSQKAAATVDTAAAVNELINYITTYPHDSITYRASNMILVAQSDASYLNESLSRSHAGPHIFSQKMTPRLYLMDQFSP